MKTVINFLKDFFENLTTILSLWLFPIGVLALVAMLLSDILVPSYTGLPDKNIPMDFSTPRELSALGYYSLIVLLVVIIITVINQRSDRLHN